VSNAIARGLRLRGIDVTATAEVGLQDASDDRQLEYVRRTTRVIFGEIIRFLQLMNDCLSHEEMRDRVEYF
jgi:hypothetical protein